MTISIIVSSIISFIFLVSFGVFLGRVVNFLPLPKWALALAGGLLAFSIVCLLNVMISGET